MTEKRILVVAPSVPWPSDGGNAIRIAGVVSALSTIGKVDMFVPARRDRDRRVPEDAPVSRSLTVPRPRPALPVHRRLGWLAAGTMPLALHGLDASALHREFRDWAAPRYDLTWVHRADVYAHVEPLLRPPLVVDLDDLEDQKIRWRLQMLAGDPADGMAGRARRMGIRIQARREIRSWSRLHAHIASVASRVVVASELDRLRLAQPEAAVLPNGYERPASPAGSAAVRGRPTLTLPGRLQYPPNADAAHWFVTRIFPRVLERFPDAELRLVGDHDDRVSKYAAHPGVVVTGHVPHIITELSRTDAIVVPIRFGGGTRIKVLEGFAHRIPVVSTSVGAEGLEVVADKHLLLADDVRGFADACVRVLRSPPLRSDLTSAAYELFETTYDWALLRQKVALIAEETMDPASAGWGPDQVEHGEAR